MTSVPLLLIGNRPIGQEEDEEGEKEEGEGAERGRRGSTLLSLAQMKTDGRTKFLYESQEKVSLQSVLNIYWLGWLERSLIQFSNLML